MVEVVRMLVEETSVPVYLFGQDQTVQYPTVLYPTAISVLNQEKDGVTYVIVGTH